MDRSHEISDGIVSYLLLEGETPLGVLAAGVRSHPTTLANSRYLYNLRLACQGAPYRIRQCLRGGQSHWSLSPLSRYSCSPIPS